MNQASEKLATKEPDLLAENLGRVPIVGITGAAGSGKDTVADYLVREFGATKLSFADPIKEALLHLFGFPLSAWNNRQWKEKVIPMIGRSPRQLAQTLGTEWGRTHVSPDLWASIVMCRWSELGQPFAVVPDVRFDNEAMHILQTGGVMLRVKRNDAGAVSGHVSELGIRDNLIHTDIDNDGSFEELHGKVDEALWTHVRLIEDSIAQAKANASQ